MIRHTSAQNQLNCDVQRGGCAVVIVAKSLVIIICGSECEKVTLYLLCVWMSCVSKSETMYSMTS